MSYFYLSPVDGNAPLHLLTECVRRRFECLMKLQKGEETEFSEYLFEGSSLDNVGHFLLGFLAQLSRCGDLQETVRRGEVILFRRRMEAANPSDARLMCKDLLKTIRRIGDRPHTTAVATLARNLIVKHIAEHVYGNNHSIQCNNHNIDVDFRLCLPLIAERRVPLSGGRARIPCGLWKHFFRILFRAHLADKFKGVDCLNRDPRWQDLISELIRNIPKTVRSERRIDVDAESALFPLCMKNLHYVLKTEHRLSHNGRFRFGLYLKDIGLGVQDSIQFWRREYSKPHNGRSSCSHGWLKDEKRFIYSIRHSYGLEGRRKSYNMPGCCKIQSNPTKEGGCAFKNTDDGYLMKLIDRRVLDSELWTLIAAKKRSGAIVEACMLYKRAIAGLHTNKPPKTLFPDQIGEFSPVNYYLSIKSITDK